MTCYIGIDYGTKRIGLAICTGSPALASPLCMVEARGSRKDHVSAVLKEAGEFDVDEFVVGLPLNMDGSEGEQAKLTRRFGDMLSELSGKKVHFFDERLSSQQARDLLQESGLSRGKKKSKIDAVAAQRILGAFLDSINDVDAG